MANIPDLTKGDPYAFAINATAAGSPVDFATTPCYLVFVRKDYRLTLKYEPGQTGNDGVLETPGGVPTVYFRLTAEWTRIETNLPPGAYCVHVRTGGKTGMTGRSGVVARQWQVREYEDGEPFQ
jgi:hypothetical protein